MGIFRTLLRLEPPRPTAPELAEASEIRLKNASEAAARERQRLIVEWLHQRAEHEDFVSSTRGPFVRFLAERIESGEPLRGRPPAPRSRRPGGRLGAGR